LFRLQKGTCGFLLLLMAVYWCTETLPLAATGLLPVVFVPMFGIMSTSAVCYNYLKDTTMMFVGGLMVAIAVENCCLHKRIALKIIMMCGTKPRW
jgi:sodium-dependent dicarboxylate transporter 2/3/5